METEKRVVTFATDNDVSEILRDYHEQNIIGITEISQRYTTAIDHYKTSSGWAEQFRENQEKLLARGEILEITRNAHLSTEDLEKFRIAYPAPAEGLWLVSAIRLESYHKKYNFEAGIIRPDFPEFWSDDFRTIPKLVINVQKYLDSQNEKLHGAQITPFFYTIQEKNLLETEEKDNVIDCIKEAMPMSVSLERKIRKDLGRPIRGLSAEEIREFEKFYFWNV